MIEIDNKEEILEILEKSKCVLLYFGAINCGVCEVLKIKIEKKISKNFSKMKQYYINSNQNFDIASYFNVFSSPTILVFFEGKEFKRYSRNMSLDIFNSEIKRLYEMVF
ncbi:thiol reductase thioredoxin [Aliarcobacter trophiarum LMG 25534]|uniref:Thioredoxin n=1 Tax=Aliarcobacter trophiarum LMG 25534 TaxID=1032241 RepID=A0AAD0QKF8_9BACT|nr:thioredoxin family protein [Aliarcobacter trophiarum]AXK49364.1 thioredoxin [Aliarcobacter trophiarum LMG 25534]RXI27818.1 thiol reductase thioredoxin [Aliarcobacter trophiarum]RXJ92018.1 thiol reductase thioredoxin [Aliarcobacter trophiarum LMG 25534]